MSSLWYWFNAALSCVLIGLAVRVFAMYLIGRIRLTDWLGYIIATAAAIASAGLLVERLRGVGLALLAGAALISLIWTLRDIQAYRRTPRDITLTGFFTVGVRRIPENVQNVF